MAGAFQQERDGRSQFSLCRYVGEREIAVSVFAPIAEIVPYNVVFVGKRGELFDFRQYLAIRALGTLGH